MSNKKYKILNVVSSLDIGGVEIVLNNYIDNLSEEFKENSQIDFIVHGNKNGFLEEKLKQHGEIYHVESKKKNFFKHLKQIKQIIFNGDYDVVHSHINHFSLIPLYYAKKSGVKKRIMHSHGEFQTDNFFKKMMKKAIGFFAIKYATELWACEIGAAKALYGNKWDKKTNNIMYNAIDYKLYGYNFNSRNVYRNKLNIQNKIVLTYVSRIVKGKNHEFLLDLIRTLPEQYILLFVGDGNLKEPLMEIIIEQELEQRVVFTGAVGNVNDYLNASDIFLFPSLSEGLGISAIEAQANGLPLICSEFIPKSVVITNNIHFLKLDRDIWKIKIKEIIQQINRETPMFTESANKYDISIQVKHYEKRISKINGIKK